MRGRWLSGDEWWRPMPPGASRDALRVLAARGIRAFGDGYVALLLPIYLVELGYSPLAIGAIVTRSISVSLSDTTSEARRPVAYAKLRIALCLVFVAAASSRPTSSGLRTTGRRRGSRVEMSSSACLLYTSPSPRD